ncbi:hypothetical protein GIB67_017333, partial [Kingdonia uniflora]
MEKQRICILCGFVGCRSDISHTFAHWEELLIVIASTYKLNEFGNLWEPNIRTKSRTLYMTTAPLWIR